MEYFIKGHFGAVQTLFPFYHLLGSLVSRISEGFEARVSQPLQFIIESMKYKVLIWTTRIRVPEKVTLIGMGGGIETGDLIGNADASQSSNLIT